MSRDELLPIGPPADARPPREPASSARTSPGPARPDTDLQKQLDRLTRGTTIESLGALLGREQAEAIWTKACRDVLVDGVADLELEQLMVVADRLASEPGAVGLVGSSLAIRVKTYQMLARSNQLRQFLGDGS